MPRPTKRPDTVEIREIAPGTYVAIDKNGFLKIATPEEVDLKETEKFEKKLIRKPKPPKA